MEAQVGALKKLMPRSLRARLRERWSSGLPARFVLIMAVVGPGIITANVDNDAGGITTYSLAGAQFGYGLLWTLIPITVALIVSQEMCARMGVVTGKGLADLVREKYGVKVTFYLMVALLIADLGNTIAEFAGVAAALEIFGVSKYVSVPLAAFFVWWLVVYGTYRRVEKVFLVACLFYVSYIISGFLAHPPWGTVLTKMVVPEFSWRGDYLAMLVGVVGTTIAPWMQFYLQAAVVEKGVKLSNYRASYYDVVIGCVLTDVVAMFIIVACAATLFENHVPIQSAQDAALALKPLAGKYCAGLFAFGLFNASLFAASILPLSTAYSVCEGFGWETGIDNKLREAPQFYGLYTALVVLGALFVLIPNFPLLGIMFFSQILNGVLLPFVMVFILLLINRTDLMGLHVNSRAYNVIAWTASAIMIVLTVAMLGSLLVWGA